MKGRLPASVTGRRKKGFGVPIGQWLRGEMRQVCEDTLSPARIKTGGIFDPVTVERLKQEHFAGKADHRKKLWTLLMFVLWQDRWQAGLSTPADRAHAAA
jgi:asparagine synthase (glutamine-hydrolysing)